MFKNRKNVILHIKIIQYSTRKLDMLPRYQRKIYSPNLEKLKDNGKFSLNKVDKIHKNEFDIQLLSRSLYKQILSQTTTNEVNKRLVSECLKSLNDHGMLKSSNLNCLPEVDFKLPPLLGKDLIEHFYLIGKELADPYKQIVDNILSYIPPKPKEWIKQSGWTRYCKNQPPESVPFPSENGLIFDVEVCMEAGKAPTLATAVSNKAWYAWVSESLISGCHKPVENYQLTLSDLIPLESTLKDSSGYLNKKEPKLVIGHNVSYDRARIREQYWLEQTGMKFLDTMSLHVCVSGLTSSQRALLKSDKIEEIENEWTQYTSLNSLKDVHKLYCGTEIEKETRDLFVTGTLLDIQKEFDKVIEYCANDVQSTYNVLKALYPMFLERFPHPVTLAGMLELSTAYLPVNSNWERFISDCEQTYEDLDIEKKTILAKRADQACNLFHNEEYKNDLWMWDQDWSTRELNLRKTSNKNNNETLKELDNSYYYEENRDEEEIDEDLNKLKIKFASLEKTGNFLPKIRPLLPGYPNWYRKLCNKPDSPDWTPGAQLLSTSMQITPKLLCLTWEGYPLHYIRELGWGFLVPFSTDTDPTGKIPIEKLVQKCPIRTTSNSNQKELSIDIKQEVERNISRKDYYRSIKKDQTEGLYKGSGIQCNKILDDCCWFIKLPHKDGPSNRVGNPLAKDFLTKFSENVLSGDAEGAQKVLSITNQISYWRNNKARIKEQMVVWLDKNCLPPRLRDLDFKFGAIIPQIVVCGTLTRRAVESTWMTASNARPDRIGSELRSMVQAPKGYNIVGADVDSQELWIASLIGDAHCAKIHGATPFGWMTLSGNKNDGTDMHSVTAKASGISRDQAKVINYARIYGAGQNFAEQLIKQFNPSMSETEARSKATKMFNLTKGKRIYRIRSEYFEEFPDQPYGRWQAHQIAKLRGKTLNEMFHKAKWIGGTESAMFNRLEEIANDPEPTTPFLNCRLSRALEPGLVPSERYLPTKINWVVQSGAVDFLHLMLVCMRWLMKDQARFCLSFHDEIRYLVKEEYRYKAALALHVTNLFTRTFCSLKLGFKDLPQSVAFFSSVEVDTVLRKDSMQDCKTPSNPHGLLKGYGIEFGESLDIYEAIKKADGHSEWWQDTKR